MNPDVYLGKESPPMPIPEFQIGCTVPLDHPHGSQLLLPLSKGST